jgi:hypothetical protein
MRLVLSVSIAALFVAGCATPPQKVETAAAQVTQERCDVMVTGTRIPRCNRDGVSTMSAEEMKLHNERQRVTGSKPGQ